MMDVLREDVRNDLPKLKEIDDEQQALYARFLDVQWEYVKPKAPSAGSSAPPGQWWKKVAKMKGGVGATLSDHWVKELSCIVSWAFESLSICRKVNDACIGRMETPEAFLEALPKHAKQLAMGDAMRKALEKGEKAQSELYSLDGVFAILQKDGIEPSDKLNLREVLSTLEKAALVWERKEKDDEEGHHHHLLPVGHSHHHHAEKAANARQVIKAVRQAQPGLGQTQLETAKLANNRDVGAAVLEAYSRVLESRLAGMRDLAEEILTASGYVYGGKGGLSGGRKPKRPKTYDAW